MVRMASGPKRHPGRWLVPPSNGAPTITARAPARLAGSSRWAAGTPGEGGVGPVHVAEPHGAGQRSPARTDGTAGRLPTKGGQPKARLIARSPRPRTRDSCRRPGGPGPPDRPARCHRPARWTVHSHRPRELRRQGIATAVPWHLSGLTWILMVISSSIRRVSPSRSGYRCRRRASDGQARRRPRGPRRWCRTTRRRR